MLPVPVFNDWVDFVLITVVVLLAFGLWLISTALLIWGERRLVSKMQSRIGPNRLGPGGIMQTLADGAKFFFKEDITPRSVDKVVYFTAPLVSAIVAMMTFAVVPFGGTGRVGPFEIGGRLGTSGFGIDFPQFCIGDPALLDIAAARAAAGEVIACEGFRTLSLQVWDPNIGILWTLAMGSIGVYGIVLAGWASGSKYPLLGGVRSSAQMVIYELAMGLGAAAIFIYTGSLESSAIVEAQSQPLLPGGTILGLDVPLLDKIPAWNLLPMFPAFVLFFVSAIAETQRPPFDLPEAEGELVAGFHTEYSGAKFAMFFLAEFMNVITMSALVVTMFLGGPSGPVPSGDGGWAAVGQLFLPIIWFLLKVGVFIFIFVWLRATLPRMRYDRLMDLGWKVMLPLGILWVFLTGFAVVVRSYLDTASGAFSSTVLPWAAIVFVVLAIITLVGPFFADPPEDVGAATPAPPAPDEDEREDQDASDKTPTPLGG